MRHPLFASFAVGLISAFVVGIGVTEVASRWIAFSLFVGIPTGLVAGVVGVAVAYAIPTRKVAPVVEKTD
ncbi:hypothetical protein C453_10770 [Haloferax elongans ATCC BAA-1513]|uniref:DUF8147 domain-containing protein n=1 Tax=Haloferax elongans ATCC BAA-1513 TaxID=1230453 RepID=M0HMR9_HALEO|nr:hypothetical protein [Haloferax elongans]ELZ85058.1 hypothetical protein C453_10770 [Haloferax elongans ATCC BAA-1513]